MAPTFMDPKLPRKVTSMQGPIMAGNITQFLCKLELQNCPCEISNHVVILADVINCRWIQVLCCSLHWSLDSNHGFFEFPELFVPVFQGKIAPEIKCLLELMKFRIQLRNNSPESLPAPKVLYQVKRQR